VAIEIEIKLHLQDGVAARERLEGIGYTVRHPRVLEADQLYDRADGELEASSRALRLRSAGGVWTLTYKGPPDDGPYKSREEIELGVKDGRAMQQVLFALGYYAAFRYEKYRTVFTCDGEPGVVMLDETPMGDFLELEGPGDWIDRTTAKLGFLTKDYVLSTYPKLYEGYQKKHPRLPRNMVFLKADETS